MKIEITNDNRKLFKFDINTEKSDMILTFLETRDQEKNIGITVNFGLKSNKIQDHHGYGDIDIETKTNNREFYKIMTQVFNKIMDFMKENQKYRFVSYSAKNPTQKEFNIRMATKRWPDIIIKENKKTNEIFFYRDKGITWKNNPLKLTDVNKTEDKTIPQEPYIEFKFPSADAIRSSLLKFRK